MVVFSQKNGTARPIQVLGNRRFALRATHHYKVVFSRRNDEKGRQTRNFPQMDTNWLTKTSIGAKGAICNHNLKEMREKNTKWHSTAQKCLFTTITSKKSKLYLRHGPR
jgi:hypothetical protein